jgi:hypothetical protein
MRQPDTKADVQRREREQGEAGGQRGSPTPVFATASSGGPSVVASPGRVTVGIVAEPQLLPSLAPRRWEDLYLSALDRFRERSGAALEAAGSSFPAAPRRGRFVLAQPACEVEATRSDAPRFREVLVGWLI